MSKLYSRKQIAELIDKNPTYVGMNIHRGKLIEENKKIDISHPINKAFIAKFTAKAANQIIDKTEPDQKNTTSEEVKESKPSGITPSNVDYVKKQHEIKRIKSATLLTDLEYQKKKAKVLPLDFVIEWSGRSVRGIFGESVNFGNSIVEQICNELGADIETKLKYKKMFKQGFNEIVKLGVKNQEPEALEYAKEYAIGTKW